MLEKKKSVEPALKEACKKTGASYHEAADELLVTGTLAQVTEIEVLVNRKVGQDRDNSGSSSAGLDVKAISHGLHESYDTQPYMAKYIRTFHKEDLKSIEQCCNVKITWAERDTKVVVEAKDLSANFVIEHFKVACENFQNIYRNLYQSVHKISLNVSQDHKEYSNETLARVVSSAPQAVTGLIMEKSVDGKTYNLWGTSTTLKSGQEWIRQQLGISSLGSKTRSLSPKPLHDALTHETPNKLRVVVCQGDITKENTDLIVNACNKHLDHAGGVSWAIATAGGPSIQQESDDYVRKNGVLSPGDVAVTGSGFLKCKYVLHAVGPQWKKHGKDGSIKLLKKVCANVFDIAARLKAKSVAMPAISSGIYGVPKEVCAQTMFSFIDELDQSLSKKRSGPIEIRLVNIDQETTKVFRQEFHKWSLKGREVQRRHSFGKATKADSRKQPPSNRSLDDMHATPSIKSSLLPNMKLPGRSKNSFKNSSSPNTSGSSSYSNQRTNANSSRSEKFNEATYPATTRSQPGMYLSNSQLINGGPTAYTDQSMISPYGQLDPRTSRQYGQNGWDSNTSTQDKTSSRNCPICQCPMTNPKSLSRCGHTFCAICIDKAFTFQKKCPVCLEVYGIKEGDQPDGTMSVQHSSYSLPGYEGYGYFIITYDIPSGIQNSRHPKPGCRFQGTVRRAYLPATKDGEVVLKLLQKAFEKKLIFTVGTSTTTGRENCVTWNDIHHKTSDSGGPQRYGYPDPDYLRRVKDELKAKGIVPE